MDGGRQQLFQFFVHEVKAHLHVVLAFSPVGDAFRNRLRLFPSLVTCTTINWFTLWPQDALQSVAERALEVRYPLPLLLPPFLLVLYCAVHAVQYSQRLQYHWKTP